MTLDTNGIDIEKLPLRTYIAKPKGLSFYKKQIRDTIVKVEENAKNGVAIFRDNNACYVRKQSIEMDF